MEIAKSISNSLAKKILVASFNNDHVDLSRKLTCDGSIKFHTWDDKEGKSTFWHSSAHMMGEALENLYGCKLTIGPPLAGGFYYDSYMGKDAFREEDCKYFPAFLFV